MEALPVVRVIDAVIEGHQKEYNGLYHLTKVKVVTAAVEGHKKQLYGIKPYMYHLARVIDYAYKYKHYIADQASFDIAINTCLLHDLPEDNPEYFEYFQKGLYSNDKYPEIEFAKMLKNINHVPQYYELKKNPLALFVKICDRLANVRECVENPGTAKSQLVLGKYDIQMFDWHRYLIDEETGLFKEMFNELNMMLEKSLANPGTPLELQPLDSTFSDNLFKDYVK